MMYDSDCSDETYICSEGDLCSMNNGTCVKDTSENYSYCISRGPHYTDFNGYIYDDYSTGISAELFRMGDFKIEEHVFYFFCRVTDTTMGGLQL